MSTSKIDIDLTDNSTTSNLEETKPDTESVWNCKYKKGFLIL